MQGHDIRRGVVHRDLADNFRTTSTSGLSRRSRSPAWRATLKKSLWTANSLSHALQAKLAALSGQVTTCSGRLLR